MESKSDKILKDYLALQNRYLACKRKSKPPNFVNIAEELLRDLENYRNRYYNLSETMINDILKMELRVENELKKAKKTKTRTFDINNITDDDSDDGSGNSYDFRKLGLIIPILVVLGIGITIFKKSEKNNKKKNNL